jgi:hypothetical protein
VCSKAEVVARQRGLEGKGSISFLNPPSNHGRTTPQPVAAAAALAADGGGRRAARPPSLQALPSQPVPSAGHTPAQAQQQEQGQQGQQGASACEGAEVPLPPAHAAPCAAAVPPTLPPTLHEIPPTELTRPAALPKPPQPPPQPQPQQPHAAARPPVERQGQGQGQQQQGRGRGQRQQVRAQQGEQQQQEQQQRAAVDPFDALLGSEPEPEPLHAQGSAVQVSSRTNAQHPAALG